MRSRADALPLVLLPGMNCTADLWTGCGVDDALTPVLDEQSIDTQVDRLLAELPPAVRARRTLARGDRRDGARRSRSGAGRRGSASRRRTRRRPPPRSRHRGGRGSTDSTPARARGVCRPRSSVRCSRRSPRGTAPTSSSGRSRWRTRPARRRCARSCGCSPPASTSGPRCAYVTVPTLLVSGAQDALCPPQFHVEIAAELPRARVVTIDGGHLLPLEQPDAFGALAAGMPRPGRVSRRGGDSPSRQSPPRVWVSRAEPAAPSGAP